MLLDIVLHQPQMLGTIVRHTPAWVWGLLAGLAALGASQLRDRQVSLARVSVMPAAMTLFAAWGNVSAFGSSPAIATVFEAWLATAAAVATLIGLTRTNATYDAARRQFAVPGSVIPLLLIAGVFLVKWGVGVELALQPALRADAGFAVSIATLYGVLSGVFIGRAARLWKLALRPTTPAPAL